jgi:succinyl-CoA synthetase alpha subunit
LGILISSEPAVLVQGITGNAGRFQTSAMRQYGTPILAGVAPGHAGEIVEGVPVYDEVRQAMAAHDLNTSIIFVPAPNAKSGVLDAINAGIKTIVVITEGIPQIDAIEFIAKAEQQGSTIVGPNCPGLINPSQRLKVGIMPGHIFKPGRIGIASRSGTLTYEIAWHLSQAGWGQSTCVGIGGDPIVGLDFIAVLEQFRNDRETAAVVLVGEIGGSAEENAALYISAEKYPKPVVAYIAGRTAPPGKRMGHAGAIVLGGNGTALSKIEAFKKAGVAVAARPSEVVRLLEERCEK